MQRILILGGGVGGTLTANLLVRKLRHRIDRRRRRGVTSSTRPATTSTSRASCTSRWAASAPRTSSVRSASLLDKRVTLIVGEVAAVDEARRVVTLTDGLPLGYDHLVLATGSRIVPEAIEHFDTEAHHFYTRRSGRPSCAPRSTRSAAAGSSSASPACPTSARRRRSRWRSSSNPSCATAACATATTIDFCSPIGRAFTIESVSDMATPILEEKGIELHTFFNVEAIDPVRKVVESLEGEELGYDLLILVPPHKGQQFLMDSGLAPAPGGWLPTDRRTLQVGGRPNVYALGDATDLPLSKAGSTAHFEAPVVAERIAAADRRPRAPAGKHADYQGKVMCFFEIGDGKGTLLQFDYDHPPPPAEAEPALAPGQDRLQQDVLAHGAEGSRLTRPASRLGPPTRSLPRAGGLVRRSDDTAVAT